MNCYLSRNYKGINSAGNKAKTDIEQIMNDLHFKNVGLKQTLYQNSLLAYLLTLMGVLKCGFCLRKGDVLVLQYPLKKYYTFVCRIAHLRGCKVITLIHDLGSFRSRRLTIQQEIARLNRSDCVIAHNDIMKKWLQKQGYVGHLNSLEIFDYLSDTQMKTITTLPSLPYRLLFAGIVSTEHNEFLYKLVSSTDSFRMVLYGADFEPDKVKNEKMLEYKGFVKSDDLIAEAEGDFGIVWYGGSLNEGAGPLGEYLQYNNPHKTSLYIRCGLPIIIWDKAALASFVCKNEIGICVASLSELDEILHHITPEQYAVMKSNVTRISQQLQSGFYFSKAIQSAIINLSIN